MRLIPFKQTHTPRPATPAIRPSRCGVWLVAAAFAATALSGCSSSDRPPIGEVEGVVTVDGKPVPNAYVIFEPENARKSKGRTDNEGRFKLRYLRDITGAVVGEHTVIITTATETNPVDRIPAHYRDKHPLIREVERGSNFFEFDLVSEEKYGAGEAPSFRS